MIRTYTIQVGIESHECMRYTTNIDTMKLIFANKTFRCSCLASGKLNDMKEKERNGVGSYADSKFIVCFSYDTHESVPFWLNYGGDKSQKVQLVFRNFMTRDLDKYINMEVALTESGRIYIGENLYRKAYYPDGIVEKVPEGFASHACIEKIELFDVEYKPVDDDTFSRSYLETIDLTLSNISLGPVQVAFPDCLGKQKTEPWDYEKETRILCTTHHITGERWWDWIDLQLKDEIFRNLQIIMSPWDNGTQRRIIEKSLYQADIPDDIKSSIQIVDSGLKDTLHFD